MSPIVRIPAAPSLRGRLLSALFLLISVGPLSAQITEYPVSVYGLSGIAAGPDGAMWFSGDGQVGRITTAGVPTTYAVPTPNDTSYSITAGPDGAMWFTETALNSGAPFAKIGRITTAGVITEFPLPNPNCDPSAIVTGSDGALWFIESAATNIGRITTSGVVTEIPLPAALVDNGVSAMTAGPDGALWFAVYYSADAIVRMTTSGVFTSYTVQKNVYAGSSSITVGPDGALWFADQYNYAIGRITTAGVITEFPLTTPGDSPIGIAAGPDGALWYTSYLGGIGRITTSGTVAADVPTPTNTAGGFLGSIAAGPDGAMWFTDLTEKIGRIPTAAAGPSLLSGSVDNGATYVAGGLVPGSWAQVKGSNLASVTDYTWQMSDFAGLGNNLPNEFKGHHCDGE
jgi:virginiamycin B lyase